MGKSLTIGHLARAAGVSVETVRYYQRVGLVQEPQKPQAGYRVYSPETVDRIKFIKRAQPLGFSLQEIAELIELGESACDHVRLRAEARREQIDVQIQELEDLRQTLDQLIEQCHSKEKDRPCPIVRKLSR